MDFLKDLDLVNNIQLCNACMEREGIIVENKECYICNGLMNKLDELFELIKDAIKNYEFNTFLIGATLPSEILEKEDEIRGRLKIRGRRSIKNEITSILGRMLSNTFNAKIAYIDPDIHIHLDLRNTSVTVRSKAIYLFGKYKKFERGIEQKIERCSDCNGMGCNTCSFIGSRKSIEGVLRSNLINVYDADDVKFSWIGGEDENSLVLNGRPFFVKIINPRRRSVDYKDIKIKEEGVEAWFTNYITRFPEKSLQFKTRFRIIACANDKIDPNLLSKIDSVNIINKNKKVKKNIYEFNANVLDDHTLEIELVADNGLPIKRLVEGDRIEPNLSKMFNTELKCKYFDVLDVIIEF